VSHTIETYSQRPNGDDWLCCILYIDLQSHDIYALSWLCIYDLEVL
jgi:hypothetical protein